MKLLPNKKKNLKSSISHLMRFMLKGVQIIHIKIIRIIFQQISKNSEALLNFHNFIYF